MSNVLQDCGALAAIIGSIISVIYFFWKKCAQRKKLSILQNNIKILYHYYDFFNNSSFEKFMSFFDFSNDVNFYNNITNITNDIEIEFDNELKEKYRKLLVFINGNMNFILQEFSICHWSENDYMYINIQNINIHLDYYKNSKNKCAYDSCVNLQKVFNKHLQPLFKQFNELFQMIDNKKLWINFLSI